MLVLAVSQSSYVLEYLGNFRGTDSWALPRATEPELLLMGLLCITLVFIVQQNINLKHVIQNNLKSAS